MPEGLFGSDIDIRLLAIETPEKPREAMLDMAEIVDPATWEIVKNYLDNLWQERRFEIENKLYYTARACLICPEGQGVPVIESAEAWDKTREYIIDEPRGKLEDARGYFEKIQTLHDRLAPAALAKIIFPRKMTDVTDFDDDIQTAMQLLKNGQRFIGGQNKLLDLCWTLKVLTGRDVVDFSVPELKSQIQATLDDSIYAPDDDWTSLAHFFARARIVLGENYDKSLLAQPNWERMMRSLLGYRERGGNLIGTFVRGAADMKILAADKVNVTAEGIEIIMPKIAEPAGAEAGLPERRSF
jgi:hypothetical protein